MHIRKEKLHHGLRQGLSIGLRATIKNREPVKLSHAKIINIAR